ncbi:fibronectin type III domain-containing protein [Croceibacter atlanticus]|uniref:fibronectin type III domain-containing protein n=1 Tax=Croceibacter atlanticus TaxID=313588 RepID=UPI002E109079|nr:T9SS type A sorting domain-containing protein [Croceibacter atlanticus]
MRKITLLLLMMLSVFYGSAQCNPGESQLFITTSGGSFPSEQWVSVTSEPDGAGTVIYAQGDGTYGNGSGDLTNEPFCATDGETYYINAYDSYADSWNGGVYTITDASGTVIANNSGESPDDGTDEDASGAFGNTQEQELEVSEAFSYTPPACAAPANALISDVTPYTAVFSWDEEPAATLGYDWRIMNEGEDPDDANNTPVAEGTTMTSSDTSVNITGLSDYVTYDAYVASNCDTNGFSDYSGVVSFTTPFDNGCGAYTSSPNLTIDDDNDPEDIIVVSGTGPQVLSDLNVALKIDHTWLSDLDITLTSPSGNSIEIISDLCGLNDNFDIVLDDEGEDFACGTPTVGVFIPEGLLSGFDGEVFDGDWTLSIIDDGGGDDGILIEWCLIPTLVDPPACEAPENLITDNIDAVSANLSWDEVAAANSGYEWVVMTDGEDPADSANTPVATGTTAASTEVTATATGLAPETDYDVYVRSNCGTDSISEYSDLVEFTTLPTCPAVSNLTVDSVDETSATISWDAVANASVGYLVEVYDFEADPETATAVYSETVTDVTLVISTLDAANSYDVYVTADCGTEDGQSTSEMITVSTTVPDPVCGGNFYDTGGIDMDFMNNEDYTVTILPDTAGDLVVATFTLVDTSTFDDLSVDIGDGNGFQLIPDLADGETLVYTSEAADGSLIFEFISSTVVPNPGWEAAITCIAPPACPDPNNLTVSEVTAFTADLSWDEEANASNGYTWVVMADGEDPTDDANTPVATGTTASGVLTASVSGLESNTAYDAYVLADCGDTDGLSVYSDIAEFTTLISCEAPSNLLVENVTVTGADLSWEEVANASNGYTWVIMLDGEDPTDTANTPVATGTTAMGVLTASVSGLTENTEYDAYVSADCGDTDGMSDFSDVESFTTPCAIVIPNYTEDFDGGVVAPDCWMEAGSGDPTTGPMDLGSGLWNDDDYLNDTVASGGSDNSASINLYTNNREDWLISPTFDLSGDTYELVYNVAVTDFANSNEPEGNGMGTDDVVQMLISEDNGATWTPLMTYDVTNIPSHLGQTEIVDLSSYTGNAVFAIWATDGTVNDSEDYDFFFDEFIVRTPLNCESPVAEFSTVDSCDTGEFSIEVNVTSLGSFSTIDAFDDQGSATQTITMTGTYTFGPYASSTDVLMTLGGDDADCNIDEIVTFVCPAQNDECDVATDLTVGQDFEDFPVNGNNIGATDSMQGDPSCGAFGFNGGDVWFTVTVPSDGILTIETLSASGSPIGDTTIDVYSGACGDLVAVACDDDGGEGAFSLIEINDMTLADQTLYVRAWEYGNNAFGEFQISAYNANVVGVEDINENANIFLYPNPASSELHISGLQEVTNVSIFNMLGQKVLSTKTQNMINVSDLSTGMYVVTIDNNGVKKTMRFIKE